LYRQNILFTFILEPNFEDVFKKSFCLNVKMSYNAVPFILCGFFTYENCVYLTTMPRNTRLSNFSEK